MSIIGGRFTVNGSGKVHIPKPSQAGKPRVVAFCGAYAFRGIPTKLKIHVLADGTMGDDSPDCKTCVEFYFRLRLK